MSVFFSGVWYVNSHVSGRFIAQRLLFRLQNPRDTLEEDVARLLVKPFLLAAFLQTCLQGRERQTTCLHPHSNVQYLSEILLWRSGISGSDNRCEVTPEGLDLNSQQTEQLAIQA